jgi:hypothetical protein
VTRQQRRRRLTRDGLLFTLGAGGFLHEVIITEGERPTLLLFCLALMGLPVFLRADDKRHDEDL